MSVKLQNIPFILSPTINYINSNSKISASMLLHFVTGKPSVDALLHKSGNRPNLPFSKLCPALSAIRITKVGHFTVTMKNFHECADIITFLFFSPHLPGNSLQENELYNTIEEMDFLHSTPGQFTTA